MKKLFLSISLCMILTGCTLGKDQELVREVSVRPDFKVQGSFLYRERILPPKDAVAIITLSDVSRADSIATILTKQEIKLNGKSVPIEYELNTDAENIHRNLFYAVRVEIRTKSQDLLWTTDETHLIDTQNIKQHMPPIILKKITNVSTNPIHGKE